MRLPDRSSLPAPVLLLLAGLLACAVAAADDPFVVEDVVLGDGTTGCLGLEPSPDMKYLAWTEQTGGRAWICGLDRETGQLVPESGKGFAIEGVSPTGNPQWGQDSSGIFLVTVDGTGHLLVIRPTSPTAATTTTLATPPNTSRQFPFPARLPARPHSYVVYEELDEGGAAGIFWVDLANPAVENRAAALPGDVLPPSLLGLGVTIYRWFPGVPIFTYAYLKQPGQKRQMYQLDVSRPSPLPERITADGIDHIDDFPTVLFGSSYLIGNIARSSTGALYRQDPSSLLASQVATVTPVGSALANPQWAVSFEPFIWGGRAYSGFQVIDGADPLQPAPGEIWLTSLLDSTGNVDTGLLRRVHDTAPVQRRDPEFFLGTSKVWLLYYGKAASSSLFRIHRADTGLRASPEPELPFRWLLPSSAHSAGAGGAFYTTDLAVANTGATDATLTLKFLGHDADGRGGPEKTFALAAGRAATYGDLLGAVFGVDSGYGAVRLSSSTTALAVTSLTATPSASGGTFGQSVPAFAEADLLREGLPRTIVAVREDASFRTNLVLASAVESPLDVDVALLADTGATLASARYALPPLGMRQFTRVVRDLGVAGDVAGARLVVSTPTPGGAFAAYAALIDNATNDPRTLLPSR